MIADPRAAKADLRRAALAARAAGGDGAALTRHLVEVLLPHEGQVLAGYWPMRNEADPRPAMAAHRGPLCLPVVAGRDRPLAFRLWQGESLQPGPWGTSHPADSAPEMRPDIVIVPLAGFDRAGNRLGYGGGFYDRTLEMLRSAGSVRAIGLAFACQELPNIPAEAFDQPLDLIVTEMGPLQPRR
ncbi:5-formyltetrahydrofolate cyclo-ligase [Paracoccus bogoriensis]|uniref:5-formyltetrahydrofolate cyclo-ligase n=1 Tax=Paracoccus bogoriensis TaxID=242065 RepID=UPI001CA55FFE|nr:5-formyltetrahydrofolate cyclo-ligase [Paracoccus bogoriensis]MBW7056690.1 5-formyltetrahydrofolate cyclo-ligase [Paracoccus bogoriensis]